MGRLRELYETLGQSPWLDDLRRDWLDDGQLARWVERGVRGLTSNPTTFHKALSASDSYQGQLDRLVGQPLDERGLYWELAIPDVRRALDLLLPVYASSGGEDGFASLELSPEIADNAQASIEGAEALHGRIAMPNLMVKVPATRAGVEAVQELTRRGRSINVTLLFSLERYEQIIEAYLSGLAACPGDLSGIHSVASFFVSRVDTEVNRRLAERGGSALDLRNQAAVAQARLAYEIFRERFSGEPWRSLQKRGARMQRLLWASTSVKAPDLAPDFYVRQLIGPDTVNTMPAPVLEAVDQGPALQTTLTTGFAEAQAVVERLEKQDIDLGEVGLVLERDGVKRFIESFSGVLTILRESMQRRDPRWGSGLAPG